ncbi:RsmB/NOP family class I SAM-dependent RNA methyltransferase [Sphingomonas sp. RHCKR47]|uniref:RsmB/NOP family class I SAM-dependent RNA methyltransferase n=1 Tax=Sphingomonas citricola TaxID=2862498 RepID=UPI001CA4E286|nr:RsmB/NOP family class I SAM-dependent RNA methyltransferase [Sphingomonas citricola]MBW6523678.1 RsmB/NOP family class I SAM-dependent RNA methyltransferase [Sphingomonas citricola]
MTPAARTQAAIELLDAIVAAAVDNGAAADTLIARYFAQRRYAGSKDRRAVRELVYAAIRLLGERPDNGRAAMVALAKTDPAIAATFDGSTHAPAPIAADEATAVPGIAPAWLLERLSASDLDAGEQAALNGRAPLDVRVNTLLTSPEAIAAELPDAQPITGLADALRLPAGTDLTPFAGRLEVQDAGSQAVTRAAAAEPGQTIVDLCAGAGGKSLALAAAMRNDGRIIASDVDRARLRRLEPRAAAAGATIIEQLLLDAGRETDALAPLRAVADTVLIDAPCSGTGTWRRNPEARWRLTPARIDRFAAMQRHVLMLGAPIVKPGGALVYIVCSLLDAEGRDQVDAFLAVHPGWQAEPLTLPLGRAHGQGLRLTPGHDGSDGFFVARLRAPC